MKCRTQTMAARKGRFLAFWMAWLLLLSGCVTRQAVEDIVETSNARMIAVQLAGEPLPSGRPFDTADSGWKVLSARIDAFVEAYPEQTAMVNAVRIRQAMLLMSYRQYNQAEAVFDQVDSGELTSARDRALYNVREPLLWWFELDKTTAMAPAQFEAADEALATLQAEVDRLQDSPEIRDYLAEIRVWIALYSGLQTTSAERATAYVENGIDPYARIFTPGDLAALGQRATTEAFEDSPVAVRRRLRAREVADYAAEVIRRQSIAPSFASAEFAELIAQSTSE